MALQVNKAVTTNQGLTVPTGSYIRATLKAPYNDFDMHWDLHWFINKAAYDAGEAAIIVSNIKSMTVVKDLTEQEFLDALGFTEPNNSVTIFNDFIIERIVATSSGYFVADDFQIVS